MRLHISMVRGNRLRPDIYISSLGSSPRVVSTGKVLESLRPNSSPCLSAELLQTLEHGHGVLPLEILVEVVLVEHDVVIAHGVQNAAGGLVAEDGGVALDEGVQVLFVRRDSLQCARSHRGGQPWRVETVTLRETRGEMASMKSRSAGNSSVRTALHSWNCAVLRASIMLSM